MANGKPVRKYSKVKSINQTAADFCNADQNVGKIKRLINRGKYDANVTRYIPGVILNVLTKGKPADLSYRDMQNIEFHILLSANDYMNLNSMHLCFPIKVLKSTNPTQNIRTDLIIVNNFLAHWIKELNIQRYDDDIQILPTNNPLETY